MVNVHELRAGMRVVLAGKTAPRLVLDVWKTKSDVMVQLKGSQGIDSEVVDSRSIKRVLGSTL